MGGYLALEKPEMLAAATGALIASAAYLPAVSRPAVQVRAASPRMADISSFGDVWGFDAKMYVFDMWDPSQPRTYTNFNPFERNDESAMCDTNGCFPGQSRGYKPPNRPDQSWAIMQEEKAKMEILKQNPKFSATGRPGNWVRSWQDNLGPPP